MADPKESSAWLAPYVAALPPNASAKGIFLQNIIDRAKTVPRRELLASAGIEDRRFIPFLDYPYADLMKLTVAGAKAVYPRIDERVALRRLGQTVFNTFLDSHVGRVLFGALGKDLDRILLTGPKAYGISMSFGTVTSEKLGERRFRYVFRDAPILIDTHQVGVIEGAILQHGFTPEVDIAMDSIGDGAITLRW